MTRCICDLLMPATNNQHGDHGQARARMPPRMAKKGTQTSEQVDQPGPPSDQTLLSRLALGDDAALRTLMDRYDTLARYTIFRTAREQTMRDPQWLDAVAGETWQGFAQSVRRHSVIESGSIPRYLTGIARQQTITALRRLSAFARHQQTSSTVESLAYAEQGSLDPLAVISELESLTALRECVAALDQDDKLLMTQLPAITQRKWVEAGSALGLSESTLRSKWAKVLERLRLCMEKKAK